MIFQELHNNYQFYIQELYNNTSTNSTDLITDISWINANIKDIKNVDYDVQEPHLDKEKCNVTFIFDKNQKIYIIYGESREPEELLVKIKYKFIFYTTKYSYYYYYYIKVYNMIY